VFTPNTRKSGYKFHWHVAGGTGNSLYSPWNVIWFSGFKRRDRGRMLRFGDFR